MRAPRYHLAIAALLLAACGSDSPTAPAGDYLGRYVLKSVDAMPVPVVLLDDGTHRLAISGGELTLAPHDVAVISTTLEARTTGLPPFSQAILCSGTFRHSGSRITITLADATLPTPTACVAGTYDATLSGPMLTVTQPDGDVLVYMRAP